MHPKYIALILFIWITGALMGAVIEASYIGVTEDNLLSRILIWQTISLDEPWGVFQIPGAVPGMFDALFEMMFFKFSFLEGDPYAELFRWVVLGPLIGLVVIGILFMLIAVFKEIVT